jgi:hypothetical protein
LQKHQEDQWNMIWWYLDYWEHNCDDETLPIINKPKHPKKGRIQGTKWKDPHPRKWKDPSPRNLTKRTIEEGEPQREHQVPKPPLVARCISNKERGEPLQMTPSLEEPSLSLEEPSLIATTHLKIEIACACCNIVDTLCL